MTAPTFLVKTALGCFALTVVDERRIIARSRSAPGGGSRDEEIQVVLHRTGDDVWWPRTKDDILAVRRGTHRGLAAGVEVLDLQPGVIAALSETVTEWASACPLLLETAGAMNRQSASQPFPADS